MLMNLLGVADYENMAKWWLTALF